MKDSYNVEWKVTGQLQRSSKLKKRTFVICFLIRHFADITLGIWQPDLPSSHFCQIISIYLAYLWQNTKVTNIKSLFFFSKIIAGKKSFNVPNMVNVCFDTQILTSRKHYSLYLSFPIKSKLAWEKKGLLLLYSSREDV